MSGSNNVREEFLEEDSEIPSQRFVLLSFLSPEKILSRKDLYFFEQFLKAHEVQWKTKNLEKFLAAQVLNFNAKLEAEAVKLEAAEQTAAAQVCRESRIPVDAVLEQYQAFVKENASDINQTKIKEQYEDFMFANEKRLEEDFYKLNNFQTSTRGLKVRGSYATQEEATARAKKLQRTDAIHNIYVAEVGKWLAWDPNPNNVQSQEYQNDQLNELMRSYKENEQQREEFFKQNPEARTAKNSKGGARTEKEIMSIVGTEEDKKESDGGSNAGGGGPLGSASGAGATNQLQSMMDSPDLAIQRKMERESNSKKGE